MTSTEPAAPLSLHEWLGTPEDAEPAAPAATAADSDADSTPVPTSLSREYLAKMLFTLKAQYGEWETGSQLMRDYWLKYADALIRHLATAPRPLDVEQLAIALFSTEEDPSDWNCYYPKYRAAMQHSWLELAKVTITHLAGVEGEPA